MTNTIHCNNINPRTVMPADCETRIQEFGTHIADQIADFCEDLSFDCILDMPDEWDSCAKCERAVLNAQEKALEIIERHLLSVIRNNGTFLP